MKIAVALLENDINTLIPDKFEDSKGLLVVETDTMEPLAWLTEDWPSEMDERLCEAVICGKMYDPILFESIALRCITRYFAGGLTGVEAIKAMLNYELPIIRDYEGGPGCASQNIDENNMSCDGGCGADEDDDAEGLPS